MEKVKLTQKQADAIESLLKKGSRDEILDTHFNIDSWQYSENRCLNGMEASHLARALYIGYEVRPKFKVGDWVIRTLELGRYHEKGRVFQIASFDDWENIYADDGGPSQDRKSTRLNSSHVAISYAVFCLKKKKQ